MLVHRDNGDRSDNGTASGKPRLVSSNPGPDDVPAQPDDGHSDDPACRDGGKANLIGDALKSVYRRTLEEDIPDDFLDLLKQLK